MEALVRSTTKTSKSAKKPYDPKDLEHAQVHVTKLLRSHQFYNQAGYQELMKAKEQRNQREHDYVTLFFTIGLAFSLFFVVTAFEWNFADDGEALELSAMDNDRFQETLEIPNTVQPPPPPPKNNQIPIIKEVSDEVIIEEVKLNIDVEMTENTVVEETIFEEIDLGATEEEAEEIFTIVEQRPEPVGGLKAFYKYVADNLKYPSLAERSGVQGKVYLKFVVAKDGSIGNVEVLKGIGYGCDMEAVKIVENSPKWIPGKQRGRPVNVYMTLPIVFVLKD